MATPLASGTKAGIRLGIDVGGTFTDLLALDERDGRVLALKTASTVAPEDAIINGLAELGKRFGVTPQDVTYFSHGTTLAVNTLLQRNGDAVGVLTTRGFRDTLELRRLRLPKANDLFVPKPVSLVPRRHMREIDERLLSDGTVLIPIDRAQIEAEAKALYDAGIHNIAICFLHSFRNDVHERQAKAWVEALLPDAYICTSSEVWPQQREYERFLISVINCYVGGRMKRYFSTLQSKLSALGMTSRIFSTKSNGGVMSLDAARDRPVQTLLSGPASGVIGAAYIGRLIGESRLITLDMGGTSVDIAVINGELPYATDNNVGDYPVIMPAVDVSAIGAGGGSIAWINPEGVLKVGPESAGAVPGPACYGRGGTRPTVTDAYVVTGICSPHNFLGGEMKIDAGKAKRAIGRLADQLEMGVSETADAILQITTANIYAGLIPQIARRGVDASDCALLPYGAAGPTHAFMVAREIGFKKVIVPPTPGLLCALGCLVADLRADFVSTLTRDIFDLDDAELNAVYDELEAQAHDWIDRERIEVHELHILRSADMCYVGQSFEINVPLPSTGSSLSTAGLAHAFHQRHAAVYGHADEASPARLIEARVQVVGIMPKPEVNLIASRTARSVEREISREIFERGRTVSARIYQRASLGVSDVLEGPCVIEQYDTNIYVPEGFRLTVDERLNIVGTPL
ncbi:hydantoinase/oxoprolinase family protein [Rhodoligotrophos defluvii]|uniref:hydantoinase/oxoprolinase family protein n=1 Tax=Rhodoligotrophos defluvii TaxID=2561934 RepID=UPI0010C9FF3D|nr:hydantoinase/oxoprolinase family protein [Rhodoligotrophos defluvii]